jgi:hypothetical protein
MLKVRVRSLQLLLLLVSVAALAGLFLFLVGGDALADRNTFQFFADSKTYMRIYAGDAYLANDTLLSVSDNYVGPLLVLQAMRGNIYFVMFFNIFVFWISVAVMTAELRMDALKIGALLLLSPLTISSLLSVNKEIFVLPFLALAIAAYVRRSLPLLLLALCASVLVRWQLTAFFLVVIIASVPLRIMRHRKLILLVLLGASSVTYLVLSDVFADVIAVVERSVWEDFDQGSGFFTVLNSYQQRGFYFLVFPLKAAHLLFALGLRVDRIMNPTNIYNDLFVGLHCAVTLITFAVVAQRRLLTLRSDLMFAAAIFLIVFCLSPIYAPRYLYPVFVALILVLAGAPMRLTTFASGTRSPAAVRPASASLQTSP